MSQVIYTQGSQLVSLPREECSRSLSHCGLNRRNHNMNMEGVKHLSSMKESDLGRLEAWVL